MIEAPESRARSSARRKRQGDRAGESASPTLPATASSPPNHADTPPRIPGPSCRKKPFPVTGELRDEGLTGQDVDACVSPGRPLYHAQAAAYLAEGGDILKDKPQLSIASKFSVVRCCDRPCGDHRKPGWTARPQGKRPEEVLGFPSVQNLERVVIRGMKAINPSITCAAASVCPRHAGAESVKARASSVRSHEGEPSGLRLDGAARHRRTTAGRSPNSSLPLGYIGSKGGISVHVGLAVMGEIGSDSG